MNPDSLAELQRQFLARMQGQPGDALKNAIAPGRMPRDVGLRIYSHAYAARLREALEHDHPVLGRYLGDERWDAMCAEYVAAYPSRHRSLRDFGNDLPRFLAATAPFAAHPEIAQLASFERALLDSFDAANAACATWEQLLAIPAENWPALAPVLHPSLRLHMFDHNIAALWRALKHGHAPPALHAEHDTWAFWRDSERVGRFCPLDPEDATALMRIRGGEDFSQVCEALAVIHAPESIAAIALGLLRKWCDAGWIACWSNPADASRAEPQTPLPVEAVDAPQRSERPFESIQFRE